MNIVRTAFVTCAFISSTLAFFRQNWETALWALMAGLWAMTATGCAGMRLEVEHTSHPLAGPPFGERSEEDSLNTVNVIKRIQKGRVYAETGLGYKIGDGGFYGPDLTATVRVGVSLEPSK